MKVLKEYGDRSPRGQLGYHPTMDVDHGPHGLHARRMS